MEIKKTFILIAFLLFSIESFAKKESNVEVKIIFDLVECVVNQEGEDVCPPNQYPQNYSLTLKQRNQNDLENETLSGELVFVKMLQYKRYTGKVHFEQSFFADTTYTLIKLSIYDGKKLLKQFMAGTENINELSDLFMESELVSMNGVKYMPVLYVGKKIAQ